MAAVVTVLSNNDNSNKWKNDKPGRSLPFEIVLESNFIYSLSAYAGWLNILIL